MMNKPLILASGSSIRQAMLENALVPFESHPARVDEEAARQGFEAEGLSPRDVADALAEMKARRVAGNFPDRLVLGSDQTLGFEGRVLAKPESPEALHAQLTEMRGKRHTLHSAAVIYEDGAPVWRHVTDVRMTVRNVSDTYLRDYIARNWDEIRHAAGGYHIEGEGIRLFSRVDGAYFGILGLPLLELVNYLTIKGYLPE